MVLNGASTVELNIILNGESNDEVHADSSSLVSSLSNEEEPHFHDTFRLPADTFPLSVAVVKATTTTTTTTSLEDHVTSLERAIIQSPKNNTDNNNNEHEHVHNENEADAGEDGDDEVVFDKFNIDAERLVTLVEKATSEGSNQIEGKDVILLLGMTDTGKTTMLQFLAGTTFEEDEDDDGLKAKSYANEKLKTFRMDGGVHSVTEMVQTTEICYGGGTEGSNTDNNNSNNNSTTVHVCDTPGFNDSRGLEAEIANSIGLIQAIHKAKSIKPILVISRDDFRGQKMKGLKDTLSIISRMTGSVNFSSFGYAFTKVENERWFQRVPRLLSTLREELDLLGTNLLDTSSADASRVKALLDDMIRKADTNFTIIDPLYGDPEETLLQLKGNDADVITDSESFFNRFISEGAFNEISIRLLHVSSRIMQSISKDDLDAAEGQMRILIKLNGIIPEAVSIPFGVGKHSIVQYAQQKRNVYKKDIKCFRDTKSIHSHELKQASKKVIAQLEYFCKYDALFTLCGIKEEDTGMALNTSFCCLVCERLSYATMEHSAASFLSCHVKTLGIQELLAFYLDCLTHTAPLPHNLELVGQFVVSSIRILKNALISAFDYAESLISATTPMKQLSKNIQTVENCVTFLVTFCDNLSGCVILGGLEEWKWAVERVVCLKATFHESVVYHCAALTNTSIEFEWWIEGPLVALELHNITDSRDFLLVLSKSKVLREAENSLSRKNPLLVTSTTTTPHKYNVEQQSEQVEQYSEQVADFDVVLVCYLGRVAASLEEEIESFRSQKMVQKVKKNSKLFFSWMLGSTDFAKRLKASVSLCKTVSAWQDFPKTKFFDDLQQRIISYRNRDVVNRMIMAGPAVIIALPK